MEESVDEEAEEQPSLPDETVDFDPLTNYNQGVEPTAEYMV